jgi:Organic solute transporter Ostalpha
VLTIFSSIALYGLIVFYGLTKEELAGRRPLAKFLSIKIIVFFTFYQSFVVCHTPLCLPFPAELHVLVKFNALKNRVIHGTQFWSSTNIADGLNALAICIEVRDSYPFSPSSLADRIQMIFFALLMMWSFQWKEYQVQPTQPHTSIWRPLWDSINLCTPFSSLSPSDQRILTDLGPQGTLPLKLALSLPILQVVSLADLHPLPYDQTLAKPSALRVTPSRATNHEVVHTYYFTRA